jgi:hypothetical protein
MNIWISPADGSLCPQSRSKKYDEFLLKAYNEWKNCVV